MNVLILEDDRYLAERIAKTLSTDGRNRVRTAGDFRTFLDELGNAASYDLFLVDLVLWGENGAEPSGFRAIRAFRETGNRAPIVAFSGLSDVERLRRAFELGADDYLIKPVRMRELEVRLEKWYRNSALRTVRDSGGAYRIGCLEYDRDANEFRTGGKTITLSKGAKRLLSAMFANAGKLMGNDELEARVWGDVEPRERNLRIRMLRLKRSLEPFWLDGWVRNVRGEGYVFEDPGSPSVNPPASRT